MKLTDEEQKTYDTMMTRISSGIQDAGFNDDVEEV